MPSQDQNDAVLIMGAIFVGLPALIIALHYLGNIAYPKWFARIVVGLGLLVLIGMLATGSFLTIHPPPPLVVNILEPAPEQGITLCGTLSGNLRDVGSKLTYRNFEYASPFREERVGKRLMLMGISAGELYRCGEGQYAFTFMPADAP